MLLIPTTLMGGTLPVLTRAFIGADRGRLRASLGRLYGLNTLGACVGTALAGFFLIEFVGIRVSLVGHGAREPGDRRSPRIRLRSARRSQPSRSRAAAEPPPSRAIRCHGR